MSYLEEVLSQFQTLNQHWINQKEWLQCQLALAEGFTNAVRHAHRNKPVDTPIDVIISVNSEEVYIEIWDYGLPFQFPPPTPPDSNENQFATGGRGIDILHKIADDLSYVRQECDVFDSAYPPRNCLIIRKKLTPSLRSE